MSVYDEYRNAVDLEMSAIPDNATIEPVGRKANSQSPKTQILFRQFLSASRALARWLANGGPRTPRNKRIEREQACADCTPPDGYRSGSGRLERCELCGCFLRIKRAMATEQCPLPEPKWRAVDADGNEITAQPVRIESLPGCGGCGGGKAVSAAPDPSQNADAAEK